MSDVISPPRSKQKPVYVSLNYLVNMTMDSNLIPAAERTLLVLQITNQAAAAGCNVAFEGFHDFFFEKKIRGFWEGEVAEIRDMVLSVIRPQISRNGPGSGSDPSPANMASDL